MKLVAAILLVFFCELMPAEARKVAVGVPVLDVTQSALYVARDRGYYQREGLEVDLILQKRVMAPLLERVNKRDVVASRVFDFALARKLNGEIKAEGWKP